MVPNTYTEYEQLFQDELVIAVRNLLTKIEDRQVHDIEDSPEHNALKRYFNDNALHRKIDEESFINRWQ